MWLFWWQHKLYSFNFRSDFLKLPSFRNEYNILIPSILKVNTYYRNQTKNFKFYVTFYIKKN